MQISSFILLEMKMTILLLKVILLVGIFTEISLSQDTGQAMKPVRCEVSAVHMGGEGHITCHYPMDLDQQPTDLNVVVEQFVGISDKHVLDCLWDDVMRCTDVRQGYKITKVTFNTLTTTISTVMEEHLGRYRCLLADKMKVYDSEFCDLLGPLPGSLHREETDQSGSDASLSVGAIAAIVIGVLSVIVIVAVVGVWRCRKRRCERAKRHIMHSTLECGGMNTGNGGMVAEETGDKDRNGRLCSDGSDSGIGDTKTETEAAVTLLNEDDDGRSEIIGPSLAERIKEYEARVARNRSDKDNRPVVRDHPPTASLERLGNLRMENGEMAENTVRQDVAFDADNTADKVAVSTPLLPSDQRPEVELVMDELDPRASQSSSAEISSSDVPA